MTEEEKARKAIREGHIPVRYIETMADQTGKSRRWVIRILYRGIEAYMPDELFIEDLIAQTIEEKQ